MPSIGLMQKLASTPQAVLYYDFSETCEFYINGSFTAPTSAFSSGFSSGFGPPTFPPGLYRVSPTFAMAWINTQPASIFYNPFGSRKTVNINATPDPPSFFGPVQ